MEIIRKEDKYFVIPKEMVKGKDKEILEEIQDRACKGYKEKVLVVDSSETIFAPVANKVRKFETTIGRRVMDRNNASQKFVPGHKRYGGSPTK